MIKEALKYIVDLSETRLHTIYGDTYSDKQLHLVKPYIPYADKIGMSTLSSLVDYIKSGLDDMPGRMLIHVKSPVEVQLYSQLDNDREREYLVTVTAQVPSFRYESFIPHEEFCINVQSKFMDDPKTDKALLLKFAGTVEDGSVAEYGDDGVMQKATVRTGIASKSDAVVPNPVRLKPYRTFIEVEQPVSDFIFRMKQGNSGVSCAIFEADGGAWKNFAMQNIRDYLVHELADYAKQFVIIS